MTHTNEAAGQVVNAYYEILRATRTSFDEGRLRAILDPDLVFEGPIGGRIIGAERFIKGVSGFAETMRSLDMVQQLSVGATAAALYDAEMPGGTVRFAEFFEIDGGRIQSLRLVFDAAEYRARGGR